MVSAATNAKRDRTWSGTKVDAQIAIDRVTRADRVVGLQLEVLLAFGLNRAEAVMFCPTFAEVPAHALPGGASVGDYLMFLRIKRGTGGCRLRYTAIQCDKQRQVLERALAAAPHRGTHIGAPG